MELTKIEIENYKSIRSPVEILFLKELPTILIGKNGSGKTNILEALSGIAWANNNDYANGIRIKEPFCYRVYIQLSEEDMAKILPDVVYDKSKCQIVAYSSGRDLKINKVRSAFVISALKKEIADVRDLGMQLETAVRDYEKQVIKLSHDGEEELPIGCYQLYNANGGLTNYDILQCHAGYFIQNIEKELGNMRQTLDDDEATLAFVASGDIHFFIDQRTRFRLEYVEPSLAKFEQKFVSINKIAIKREITKINKATKDACDRIERLIKEIEERANRLQKGLDMINPMLKSKQEEYDSFLQHIQRIMGQKCLFLKNESNNVIFKKEDGYYREDPSSSFIMKTYLQQVYDGSDREELLRSSETFTLSGQALSDFEAFLNENIPSFDLGMYNGISVETGAKGHIAIFLHEKTGEKINLDETSAGRRWYFTYYFMKNILREGDMFMIDEPAGMLHPSAQREILSDFIELTRRGVKVVYATHSPYLIPSDTWQNVHFVTMTDNGTQVNAVSSYQESVFQMREIVGEDIFDIQTIVDNYTKGDPVKIGKNCYDAVKKQNKNLEDAAKEMVVSNDTIKSWNRKGNHFRRPNLENVLAVCKYTNTPIKDLLN